MGSEPDSRRILIVDPAPLFAEEVRSLFSAGDCDVQTAESVSAAAQKLRDVEFDCVIVDESLPDMKGYDAVGVIKAISPRVQIIMTAERNTRALESRIRQADIFYYYVKSFDRSELVMAVRDAFRKVGKPDRTANAHRPARILIIDDDRDFVAAMESVLKSNSYEVSAAYDKNEAMQMLESVKPDLVLLDVMMGGVIDGLTICKKLKYDQRLRHIAVLAVSSITDRAGLGFPTETAIEDFAADEYLAKPVRPADLLERVAKLLDRRLARSRRR